MLNRRSFFAASAAGIAAGVLPGVPADKGLDWAGSRWITMSYIGGKWVEIGRSPAAEGIQFVRSGAFKTNQFVQISQGRKRHLT